MNDVPQFKTRILPIENTVAYDYLTQVRKLSLSTLKAYRVGVNNYGEICIPFYNEHEKLLLIKRRANDGSMLQRFRTLDNGARENYECKTDCEAGGKPVLLGSHLPRPLKAPLYICYGDYDAMSAYEAMNFGRDGTCVSLPFGDKSTTWIDKQWEYLEGFNKIVFCPDFDKDEKVRLQLSAKLEEMSRRLGKHRCYVIREEYMKGCKDLNELHQKHGESQVRVALVRPTPVPEPGLIRLVDYADIPTKEGDLVGFRDVDKATGGHCEGGLSIISGDNNAGKTTLVLNMIANFAKQGKATFYWTAEQRPDKVRWWLEQIIAGPHFVDSYVSPKSGREYHRPKIEVLEDIRKWYQDLVYVYDKRGIDAGEFFQILELAVRRYNIKHVFIDNLQAFTGNSDNYLQAQGDFAESCKNFAEDWNCHIHLIAHNRKVDDTLLASKDDVEGSKKITNWADNVYQLKRITKNLRAGDWNDIDGILSLCKNRETETLVDVRLLFEPNSKRLFQYTEPEKADAFMGWENENTKFSLPGSAETSNF
jgi:twinkle protein